MFRFTLIRLLEPVSDWIEERAEVIAAVAVGGSTLVGFIRFVGGF